MAHYALIDENNIVQRVLFVNNAHILGEDGNENHEIGISMCREGLNDPDARLIRTSINANIRFRYESLDAFIPPKPFSSWSLNTTNYDWEAPVPQPEPEEGFHYVWNEGTRSWNKETISSNKEQ
jgi:hypothetical protein